VNKRNGRSGDLARMFAGDLRKDYSEFAATDVAGSLLRQGRIENDLEKMREFSGSIPARSSSHRIVIHLVLGAQAPLREAQRDAPQSQPEQGDSVREGEDGQD
jgi:hypothetical protein